MKEKLEHISTQQFLDEVWADYHEREKDPEKYRPIKPIVPELADQFGGYLAGQFGVWGAPPKGGKSAALMSSLTHTAKEKPFDLVGYISNEMWKIQLGRSLISNIARVDRTNIYNVTLDDGQKRKVDEQIRDFGTGINCHWAWNITDMDDVLRWIDMVQNDTGQKMTRIIIDYIHLMKGKGRSRMEEIPYITRRMKMLTTDPICEGIMVESAAQLNQEHIKARRWEQTSFLYGGVQMDADWAVIIAPHIDANNREVKGRKELHTVIAREGQGGMTHAAFVGEYSLVTGLSPQVNTQAKQIIDNMRYVAT